MGSLVPMVASTLVFCGASLAVGIGLTAVAGFRTWSWTAPGVGIAALMIVSSVAVRLPGHGDTAVIALVGLSLLGVVLGRRQARPSMSAVLVAAAAGSLVFLAALLPFFILGRTGILGVGFNNDLAFHLLWSEGLRNERVAEIFPVSDVYPLGPHALVATVAGLLQADLEDTMNGFLLAVPILTALVGLAALDHLKPASRVVAAVLVGLAFLPVAYYGQGSFKEPLQGLLVLCVALSLRELVNGASGAVLRAVPLSVLAAGSVYAYSYYALSWVLGVYVVGLLAVTFSGGSELRPRDLVSKRGMAVVGIFAVGLTALVAPELTRSVKLFSAAAFSPAETGAIAAQNTGNLGDLSISFLEVFGLWASSDFRYLATNVFYAGGLPALAFGAAVFGTLWSFRRRDVIPVVAAVVCLVIWARAASVESPYVAAKTLVIASPIVSLITLRAILDPDLTRALRGDARAALILARSAFVVAAGISAYLALSAANVGPSDHGRALREVSALIGDDSALFLGNDDFVRWHTRGRRVLPAVLGGTRALESLNKPWVERLPVDFDSLSSKQLNKHRYVITTAASYQSQAPLGFRLKHSNSVYRLWERYMPVHPHRILAEAAQPANELRCSRRRGQRLARRGGLGMPFPEVRTPLVGPRPLVPGQTQSVAFFLPEGRWSLSLQYTSPTPVLVAGPRVWAPLPANSDRFGPMWPAGTMVVDEAAANSPLRVYLAVGRTRFRWRGTVAEFGRMRATRVGSAPRQEPLGRLCGRDVDYYWTGSGGQG